MKGNYFLMEEYKKYKQISYCLRKSSSSILIYNANSIQNKVSLESDCHINRKENEDLLCSIIRYIEFVVTRINKILLRRTTHCDIKIALQYRTLLSKHCFFSILFFPFYCNGDIPLEVINIDLLMVWVTI